MTIEISEEDGKYMYALVERIVNEVGPRMSCSPQEAQGTNVIKEELEKSCDDVGLESFSCHPRAFLGWIKIVLVLSIISICTYLVMQLFEEFIWLLSLAAISFGLIILAFIIMWEEFFNYKEFIDPLFRKKQSQNVIGKFNPKGEPKKIIIFSSHIDSALQFTLLKLLGKMAFLIVIGAIFIFLIWIVISFIILVIIALGFLFPELLALKGVFVILTIILLIVGMPCFITLFFFVPRGDKGNVVPGSVDNLSSCSVVVGLSRYLKNHGDIIPANTEIRLISFGCEEAGLRGAYRYAAAHLDELKKYDAMVVNMDGLDTPDKFKVIEFEPTTRTWHSEEVVQKLLNAAKSAGIEAHRFGTGKLEKTIGRLSGGSDAAAFSKANIKAALLYSADLKIRATYYHQDADTPDKIQPGTLENALKICIAFLINEAKNPDQ